MMLNFFTSALLIFVSTLIVKSSNPPGTVPLHDNVFIDQNEVSNLAWIEYISWLTQKHGATSTEVKNAMPENSAWKELYKEDFKASAFQNKYINYPVVGISYAQAIAYCDWRSARVNQLENTKTKVQYKLPTQEEFTLALALEKVAKSKQYNSELQIFQIEEKANKKHTYQVSGNVSEMTTKVGEVFGENYLKTVNKEYTAPKSWLGFRCVAEYQ